MSQRASTARDDGIDLSTSWTWLNSTVTNGGHRRFVDRYVRSPPEVPEWMEEIAAAGPRKRKIMAKAARMAIQQVRKETGRDEHGRLLRKKGSIDTEGSLDLPKDQTDPDNNMERVKPDECLKTESDLHVSETFDEYLESVRIAQITGWKPEEVKFRRSEAVWDGEEFDDVVAAAAAAAAKPESWADAIRAGRNSPNASFSYARPSVEYPAKTTTEGAVETTEANKQTAARRDLWLDEDGPSDSCLTPFTLIPSRKSWTRYTV